MNNAVVALFLLFLPPIASGSEEMIREFLDDLADMDFVTAAISTEHGEKDQSKAFATLWFDQGQFLAPKAKEALKKGLRQYPVIFLKKDSPIPEETYEFADYVGYIWFARASGAPTKWGLHLGDEDFATLTKFLEKENDEGETTISFGIRWIDSERILYQTGLIQGKEREGEDFTRFDEP